MALETNYGARAKAGTAQALAGAAHLFLIEFDKWRSERGLEDRYTGSGAEVACNRLRGELTDNNGMVALYPDPPGFFRRARRAWRVFRGR